MNRTPHSDSPQRRRPTSSIRSVALVVAIAAVVSTGGAGCSGDRSDGSAPRAGQEGADPTAADPTAAADDAASGDASALADRAAFAAGDGAARGLSPHAFADVRDMLRAGDRVRAKAALRFSIDAWEGEDAVAATYVLGRLLTDDLDPAGLPLLASLPAPFEPAEDRRLLWLARALALPGPDRDPNAALEHLDALLALDPTLDEREQVVVTRAALLAELGRTDDARTALREVADDRAATRDHRADALLALARLARGDDVATADAFERRLLVEFPATAAAHNPAIVTKPNQLDSADRFARAVELYERWAYDDARIELEPFLDDPKRAVDAAWYLGLIGLRKLRDDTSGAREMFEQVYAAGGRRKAEALWQIMRAYMREENYDEALKIAARYETEFPKGERVDRMSYYRGWLPYDHRDCKTALAPLEKHWRNGSYRRSVTHGFWAWCFVRQNDWEGAIEAFESLAATDGDPLVRGKAWYWQAVSMNELGRTDDALAKLDALRDRYAFSYYGVLGEQLRATIEGRDPRASLIAWPDLAGTATDHDADTLWDLPVLEGDLAARYATVRKLVELDEIDLARKRWDPIRKAVERAVTKADRMRFVNFMSHQIEDFSRGWRYVGANLTRPGTPDPTDLAWAMAYPRAYRPLVERLAADYDLHPALVYSIMRQESRYRPRQVSSADAVGALQMIPKTARKVAEELGVEFDLRTFQRPEVGFEYSLFYLRKHFDLWHEQLVPTAASYNGGPAPIALWLEQNAGQPMVRVIEEFAYNESRIYCRKVAEHMVRYLYLYEADPEIRGRWLDALFPVEFVTATPDDIGY